MHIIQATVLGIAVWIATMAAAPSVGVVISGPFIVSGVALAACLLL